MRIKLSRRQIGAFVLAGLLLSLNFTMRYGVWKKMQRYTADKTRYEKLALAYHLDGKAGIEYELKDMAKRDPASGEFVRLTPARIKAADDVRGFIESSMTADRDKIKRLKSDRAMLSGFIYLVLAGQALFNIRYWWKDNHHHFKKQTV